MSNPILVLGAGRSSVSLLYYLNDLAKEHSFRVSVADGDSSNLELRTKGLDNFDNLIFEALDEKNLAALIGNHKIVISLLPPPLHPIVAKACLVSCSNLVTASYESDAMRELASQIKEKGLIFINECGLDPGIDHMSAMEVIKDIQAKGGEISKFHSYCGGLVADEYDNNPFRYKISWNPRNVVLAGKGVSRFLANGRISLLPYQRLFSEPETVFVPDWGNFEAYPNRDSIPYISVYGLKGIKDLKRGTLRKPGFCERWAIFVRGGLTDDESLISFDPGSSYFDYLKVFFPGILPDNYTEFVSFVGNKKIAEQILDLGMRFENPVVLSRNSGTPADFLLDLIVRNWALNEEDQDLVVMLHEFRFKLDNVEYQTVASFGIKGSDSIHTAMAKTVGLPLGIVAKLLFLEKIDKKGLLLPLHTNIFKPVMEELSTFGLIFQVTTQTLKS